MKIIYYTLLLSPIWGFVVQCNAQGVIFKGNIIHTSGAPLQVVVENNSTGAYLLATCDSNGNYSINISSLGEHFPISSFFFNCDSAKTDTSFTVTDTSEIVTWNSNYCINFAGPNAIIEGQISGQGGTIVTFTPDTGSQIIVAHDTTDSSGNYSVTIYPPYSVAEIKCLFINCHLDTIDTVLFVNRNILTWNSVYCPTPKNVNATLHGRLSNTNGTAVAIHLQIKDTTMIEDTLHAQTDSEGNYSVIIPYLYFNDSIKCVFSNCNNKSIDTIFVLQDTVNTWNETFCLAAACPLSFTSSYCPCSNTFYLQLDTSSIPYTHWNVKWNFGEGDTSTQLFPSESFSSRSLYNVCVSLFDSSNLIPVCNFCHSLGFDSTGNLVTRVEEAGGFNLQVIPTGTLQQYLDTPPNSFSLYPNPAGSEAGVMIYSDEATTYNVAITNLLGQQVFSTVQNVPLGSSTFKMDIHSLTSGAYFITIHFEYGQITKMFLKN